MDKLAIHGGTPVRGPEKRWPTWPVWDDRERQGLLQVLESGKWWYGDQVRAFEAAFAAYQKAKYCVTATSGTMALETCLIALDIGPGDEVIIPAYTFVATASCVLRVGATPVFADIDPVTFCVDPASVATVITPRTRAIMPVHFGGMMADMDALGRLAAPAGPLLLEDACHAWGTVWKGTAGAGTIGHAGCFSFQASKNMTAGEGGAIVTNNGEFAEICRSYTNCGRNSKNGWYQRHLMGANLRLTEFHAALLLAQLSRLPEHVARREENATLLNEWLGGIPGMHPVPTDPRVKPRSYHLYCIRLEPSEFGCSRAALIKAAEAEGVPIGPGYPRPVYKEPAFTERRGRSSYRKVRCPGAEKICSESGLWLRQSILLGSRDDMRDIAAAIRKIQTHAAELKDLG